MSAKMLHESIVENYKIDAYLGQVWLSKGWLCPAVLGKGLGQGSAWLEPPCSGQKQEKTPPQIISNNPRSSIKPDMHQSPIL